MARLFEAWGVERMLSDEDNAIEPPFDCPHCGAHIIEIEEEFTVGTFSGGYPHSICPRCGICMGCAEGKDRA